MISLADTRSSMNTEMIALGETIQLSAQSHQALLAVLPDQVISSEALDGDVEAIDVFESFSGWIDQNQEGFYVRDLDVVATIIERLLEFLIVDFVTVEPILERLLEVCSLPLMELKANERLSVAGYDRIKKYFHSVSELFSINVNSVKTKIAKCFRCIANGGKDPTLLRAQHIEWVPDGKRLRITDVAFIERVLRDSGALETAVMKFLDVCEDLHYKADAMVDMNALIVDDEEDLAVDENKDPFGSADTDMLRDDERSNTQASLPLMEDDPEMYGVPKSFLESRRQALEAENKQKLSEQGMTDLEGESNQVEAESPLSRGGSDSPKARGRTRSQETIGSHLADDGPVVLRDLSQMLLELCLELSRDPASALAMSKYGLCGGAIIMMDKDFKLNPRDKRIGVTIELMWNVLEATLDHFKSNSASPDEVRNKLDTFSQEYPVADFANAIAVLQTNLIYVLNEGFRLSDKELRNEILIILTLLAHFPCAVDCFTESGLFHLFITYACIEETGADSWDGFISNLAKLRNFAAPSDIDYEFKKSLWFIISELLRARDSAAPAIFASSPLQSCMLRYIEHDSFDKHSDFAGEGLTANSLSASQFEVSDADKGKEPEAESPGGIVSTSGKGVLMSKTYSGEEKGIGSPEHESSPLSATMPSLNSMAKSNTSGVGSKRPLISTMPLSKLREFQVLAVTFLQHNAPIVMPHFEELDGPARVAGITVKYCQSEVLEHKALIFNALILLQRCLVHSLSVRMFMENNDLMRTYLYVFHKSEHEQTRAQALRLIGCLCMESNEECQRNFFQLVGVADLVAHLSQYVRNRPPLAGTKAGIKIYAKGEISVPDPFENPYGGEISMVVIAAIDCLSKAVVGNQMNEAHFADVEGLDVLLEMVETTPFLLRIQALRLLVDLLQNGALVCYVNAWRSAKTLRSAAQILCHSWLDEEARLVGQKRRNGIIRDVWHPLSKEDHMDEEDDSFSMQSPGTVAPYENLSDRESSLTVTKLATAILAGRNATQTNLPIDICNQVLERDCRVLIAEILRLIGVFEIYGDAISRNDVTEEERREATLQPLDLSAVQSASSDAGPGGNNEQATFSPSYSPFQPTSSQEQQQVNSPSLNERQESPAQPDDGVLSSSASDLGLSPLDQQIVAMAKKYDALREGEWWQAVRDHAAAEGVVPIEADQALMDSRLELSCDAAALVQVEQIALYSHDQKMKKQDEDTFIDQIITKKNQQIKAEWLKKKGRTVRC